MCTQAAGPCSGQLNPVPVYVSTYRSILILYLCQRVRFPSYGFPTVFQEKFCYIYVYIYIYIYIYQQQHSCETLICQCHQTTLRLLSSASTASTRWRVRELYCPTTYMPTACFMSSRTSDPPFLDYLKDIL